MPETYCVLQSENFASGKEALRAMEVAMQVSGVVSASAYCTAHALFVTCDHPETPPKLQDALQEAGFEMYL